jgi:hypothetical protein
MNEHSTNPHAKEGSDEGKRRTQRIPFTDTAFEIMPWENPQEFALLHTKVAEDYLPQGPVQEDLVFTIVKAMWLKRRNLEMRVATNLISKLNPDHAAFDEALALTSFSAALLREKLTFEEIKTDLRGAGYLAKHLRSTCPMHKFKTAKAWAKAMLREIQTVLMPRFSPRPDELYMEQAAALMTYEILSRDLDLEERYDAVIEQSSDRILKLQAAQRDITVGDRRRFDVRHPVRLAGVIE